MFKSQYGWRASIRRLPWQLKMEWRLFFLEVADGCFLLLFFVNCHSLDVFCGKMSFVILWTWSARTYSLCSLSCNPCHFSYGNGGILPFAKKIIIYYHQFSSARCHKCTTWEVSATEWIQQGHHKNKRNPASHNIYIYILWVHGYTSICCVCTNSWLQKGTKWWSVQPANTIWYTALPIVVSSLYKRKFRSNQYPLVWIEKDRIEKDRIAV